MTRGIIAVCVFLGLIIYVNGAPVAQSGKLAAKWAGAAASSNSPVGEPHVFVKGTASANDVDNWKVQGNLGVGAKVYESDNGRHSVGVGANYGQSFGEFGGNPWNSQPDFGVGFQYNYRF